MASPELDNLERDEDLLVAELRACGVTGENWNHLHCPWHGEDRDGSLAIFTDKDSGKAMFKCHAGACNSTGTIVHARMKARNCDYKTAVNDLLRNGHKQVKVHHEKKPEKKEHKKHDSYDAMILDISKRAEFNGYKFVKAWNYTDPITGEIEYVTIRTDHVSEKNSIGKTKKRFLPAHRIPTGFQEGGIDVNPIYMRKEMADAPFVVVVEGEKCAAALAEIGFVTTTSPGGSKSAQNADWSPLKGKEVAIWRDNDDDGKAYEDKVVHELSLLDPPCVVRAVNIPNNLPDGGDVVDFIEELKFDGKEDETIKATIQAFLDSAPKVGFFVNHVSLKTLLAYNTKKDPNCLLGRRWICKGGSCLFAGQTGLGKSTLAAQCAILWALGRSAFGIPPIKPLKSVFIQAENDIGDLAEQCQGVIGAMNLYEHADELDAMIKFVTEDGKCGDAFTGFKDPNEAKRAGRIETNIGYVERIVRYYRPDLVWVDPLHAYIGGDINKAEVCARFLRNGLNPIGHKYGCAWMIAHHTTKPKLPDEKKGMTHSDYSYQGAGSAELSNWARATMSIHQREDGLYELKTNKRWKRALLSASTDPFAGEQNPISCIVLKHSQHGLCWLTAETSDLPGMHDEKQEAIDAMVQVGMESMVRGKQYEIPALRIIFAKAIGKAVATTYTKHSPVCQAFAILMANCKVAEQPNLFTLPASLANHSPSHSPSAVTPDSPIRHTPVGCGDGELANQAKKTSENGDPKNQEKTSEPNLPWNDDVQPDQE